MNRNQFRIWQLSEAEARIKELEAELNTTLIDTITAMLAAAGYDVDKDEALIRSIGDKPSMAIAHRIAQLEELNKAEQDAYHLVVARELTHCERIAQLKTALKAVEWGEKGRERCAACMSEPYEGHTPDCIVGQALEGGK